MEIWAKMHIIYILTGWERLYSVQRTDRHLLIVLIVMLITNHRGRLIRVIIWQHLILCNIWSVCHNFVWIYLLGENNSKVLIVLIVMLIINHRGCLIIRSIIWQHLLHLICLLQFCCILTLAGKIHHINSWLFIQ